MRRARGSPTRCSRMPIISAATCSGSPRSRSAKPTRWSIRRASRRSTRRSCASASRSMTSCGSFPSSVRTTTNRGPAPAAQLSGELTLELQVVGPAHVLAAGTVDRPIAIALADPTGLFESDGAIRFAAPASQPLSFEVDATARTFVADLALANVTAHLPGRDFMLAAATGAARYDGSALALTGVALSASESVNAHVAATLAVSSFDATLADAAGLETLTPSPRLELASFVDHGLLGDAAPAFDVTHLVLDGAVRGDATMLAVMPGALTVTTSPTPFGFVASAGACVTADPWAVATCN